MHDRISEVCSVPSESIAKPGTPRLSGATVRGTQTGPIPLPRPGVTVISASARSWGSEATAVRSALSRLAMTSTGSVAHPAGLRPASTRSPAGLPPAADLAGPLSAQLPFDLVAVDRVGRGEDLVGEGVLIGAAERDAGVRQVGVDAQAAVAGLVGAALQVAVTRRAPARPPGHAPPGPIGSVGATTSATATARTPSRRRRGQPEPAVGRVVQCPRVLGGVNGLTILNQARAVTRNHARPPRRRPR